MGRRVSREQGECEQAQERHDTEGEPLAARHARRGGQRAPVGHGTGTDCRFPSSSGGDERPPTSLPQQAGVPSASSAQVCFSPALMGETQ